MMVMCLMSKGKVRASDGYCGSVRNEGDCVW